MIYIWITIFILMPLAAFGAYLYGETVGDRKGLARGKDSMKATIAGLERELRILSTHPGTTQAVVIEARWKQI